MVPTLNYAFLEMPDGTPCNGPILKEGGAQKGRTLSGGLHTEKFVYNQHSHEGIDPSLISFSLISLLSIFFLRSPSTLSYFKVSALARVNF